MAYGFGRLNEELLSPPEPREIDWCELHDEDAMECPCSEDDPDKAYDEMRERWLEALDND